MRMVILPNCDSIELLSIERNIQTYHYRYRYHYQAIDFNRCFLIG